MKHVNGWYFRGIYKGGLWENDLHVSALKYITSAQVDRTLEHSKKHDSRCHKG